MLCSCEVFQFLIKTIMQCSVSFCNGTLVNFNHFFSNIQNLTEIYRDAHWCFCAYETQQRNDQQPALYCRRAFRSQETSHILESITQPDCHQEDLHSVKIKNKQVFLDEARESLKRDTRLAKIFPEEKGFPSRPEAARCLVIWSQSSYASSIYELEGKGDKSILSGQVFLKITSPLLSTQTPSYI